MKTALELCGGRERVVEDLTQAIQRHMSRLGRAALARLEDWDPALRPEEIARLAYDPRYDFQGKAQLVTTLLGVFGIPYDAVIARKAELAKEEHEYWRCRITDEGLGYVYGADDGRLPLDFEIDVLIGRAALAELCGSPETASTVNSG